MKKKENFFTNPIFIAIFAAILGIIALIGAFVILPKENVNYAPRVDHFWGKNDSKVVLKVYSDFQCPGCASFYQNTETKLRQNYSDKIKYVYIHFPLNQIHPNAQRAAEASEAAAAQGKFWEYHNYLFDRQSEATSWTSDKLTDYASALGMDTKKFKDELNSRMYKKAVQESRDEALSKNLPGTPSVFLNDTKLSDEEAVYENIEIQIKKLLGEPIPTPTSTLTTTPTTTPSPDQEQKN